MKKEERIKKQKERLIEMKHLESQLHAKGFQYIAGVDEVGRGPLAGPVVTAAVVLPEDFDVLGIDDSKKLSEKRREELFEKIIEGCVAYGIGVCDHKVIDKINILQATKEAMKKAVAECEEMLGRVIELESNKVAGTERTSDEDNSCNGVGVREVSGKAANSGLTGLISEAQTCESLELFDVLSPSRRLDYILFDAIEISDLDRPQEAIIKGDSKVIAIAAASIVAKVTRDRMMVDYAKEYPWYAFEKNKGYGTAAHYAGIREHGVCPIHRITFLKNLH